MGGGWRTKGGGKGGSPVATEMVKSDVLHIRNQNEQNWVRGGMATIIQQMVVGPLNLDYTKLDGAFACK
uniref:Uncharacterized protein n=1 Tax=Romanomermis culicivorax TaxID=13658 RepID=A0A915KNX6_ROMCU